MTRAWMCMVAAFLALPGGARAHLLPRPFKLDRLNRQLAGKLVDHTNNHGLDRRIWSKALGMKRDLYVYLPPGYDPAKKYPFILMLHGFLSDEVTFADHALKPLDEAIRTGKLPPVVVAAPDGTVRGLGCVASIGTFYFNSRLGNFEDYVFGDVLPFVLKSYSIRDEPEARAIVGVSMGGCAAYSKTMKYPDLFKNAAAIYPPLNLRWMGCKGRHSDKFDPACWGWREDFSRGYEVLGRYYAVITFRQRRLVYPLFGRRNEEILPQVAAENPIELLDAYDVKPGQFGFYVAYVGRDEFNLDSEIESFLHRAKEKGIEVSVEYDAKGRHNLPQAVKFLPGLFDWLNGRLAAYAPR
ncbi:MAG: hypothetical protein K2W96_18135 [Gemmataceae bacterium]|nr:hypothetical protein [Gemmataceae bacterium]